MYQFEYTITDPIGIHARPAGLLAKEAAKYQSKIFLSKGGKKAEARRLISIMSMGVKQGAEVTVTCEGGDEEAAAAAMETFFKENL